jgi:hypothetical protein
MSPLSLFDEFMFHSFTLEAARLGHSGAGVKTMPMTTNERLDHARAAVLCGRCRSTGRGDSRGLLL